MNKRGITTLTGIGVYLIVTGISYALFSARSTASPSVLPPSHIVQSPGQKPAFKIDLSIPRDQECPLTGGKYTKNERDVWETRRPLAVMIENSIEARPHSGISRAEIVYEALAEGWITRFMAIFYCNTPFENIAIAPVRSARTYFIDWVSEYDALYTHVGGANRIGENAAKTDPRADALGQIDKYGIKDMDQFGIGYPDCYRNPDRLDHPVATEHSMVCFSENLFKIAEKREWTNVDGRGIPWDKNFSSWKIHDEPKSINPDAPKSVKLVFSQGHPEYDVQWEFDEGTKSYKRTNGGVPHRDLDADVQITAKNVIIQIVPLIGPIDENGHFLYTTIGSGKAFILQDGNYIDGTWKKQSRVARTVFFDRNGREATLARGNVWIEIIPDEQQITY